MKDPKTKAKQSDTNWTADPTWTGEYVSGHELLLMDALRKIEEQDERIKELENSVYMLERTVYSQEE